MAWVVLSFPYESKLTSTQMQNLRDNIAAAFAKDSGSPVLANDYIVEAMLGNLCVGEDNIIADAVVEAKIADGEVTWRKLHDGAVIEAKLGDDAVTELKIDSHAVVQTKIKTSTGEVSETGDFNSATATKTLSGGSYSFYPQVKTGNAAYDVCASITVDTAAGLGYAGTSYAATIRIGRRIGSAPGTVYAENRYVTSSGELFWIYLLREKSTKKITSVWAAPDHPCFGNGGNPKRLPQPFVGVSLDNPDYELLLVNPEKDIVEHINNKIPDIVPDEGSCKGFIENFWDIFDIKDYEVKAKWPEKAVTVGLSNYNGYSNKKTETIKRAIPENNKINIVDLKLK